MKPSFCRRSFIGMMCTLLISAVVFQACYPNDKCRNSCLNGGVCSPGSKCLCPSGTSGDLCETIDRTAFIGDWQCKTGSSLYAVSIETAGMNPAEVQIVNFKNSFLKPVAAQILHDSLYIAMQTIGDSTVSGKGYMYVASSSKNAIVITSSVYNIESGVTTTTVDSLY